MKILEDKQNPLLKRKEVKVVVKAEKNPTMQEAAKAVAQHFKSEENCIAVNLVKGRFGRDTFLIVANIYESKEDKDKTEPAGKKGKKAEQQEQKAEGKPAEATAEQQPATENPKAEQKTEEKQEGA